MEHGTSCPLPGRVSLNAHLYHKGKVPDQLRHLILDIARATKYIQNSLRTTETGLNGTHNESGEQQLKLDVLSDDIISQHLCESRLVASFASEEHEEITELNSDAPFSVVYDPLDGSSLVDSNFAIGSIFGIYPGKDIIGRTPREQVAALYVLYGPRTVLVYASQDAVHSFILNEVGEFIVLREYLGIADIAKNYSPGNLRAVKDNDHYAAVMNRWLNDALTLRYSGCMVADIHHILSKGQGIFTNVGGKAYPEGKLRLAFECGPFAYVISRAGGSASDGIKDILDKPITSIHERTPFIAGSSAEVMRVCTELSA
jgi:fructose-1,6-bisphosphatase I